MSKKILVRANVGVGGLAPGTVGELPESLANMVIAKGFASRANSLSSRLRQPATVLGVAQEKEPSDQTGGTLGLTEPAWSGPVQDAPLTDLTGA